MLCEGILICYAYLFLAVTRVETRGSLCRNWFIFRFLTCLFLSMSTVYNWGVEQRVIIENAIFQTIGIIWFPFITVLIQKENEWNLQFRMTHTQSSRKSWWKLKTRKSFICQSHGSRLDSIPHSEESCQWFTYLVLYSEHIDIDLSIHIQKEHDFGFFQKETQTIQWLEWMI